MFWLVHHILAAIVAKSSTPEWLLPGMAVLIRPQRLYAISGNWHISQAVHSRAHQGTAISGSQGNRRQCGSAGSKIFFKKYNLIWKCSDRRPKNMYWPMCTGNEDNKARLKKKESGRHTGDIQWTKLKCFSLRCSLNFQGMKCVENSVVWIT